MTDSRCKTLALPPSKKVQPSATVKQNHRIIEYKEESLRYSCTKCFYDTGWNLKEFELFDFNNFHIHVITTILLLSLFHITMKQGQAEGEYELAYENATR